MANPFFNSDRAMAHYKFVNLDKYEKFNGSGVAIFLDDTNVGDHVATSRNTIKAILPEATVLSGSIGFKLDGDTVNECNVTCNETGVTVPFEEFIVANNVKLINNSKEGRYECEITPKSAYMKQMIAKHNLIMTASAGNARGVPANSDYIGSAIIVSQATLDGGNVTAGTHCIGENVDFVMFSGYLSGTSFASPFLLGIIGKFLQIGYPTMTQEHAYRVLKNICKDYGDKGKDDLFGYGLPVLPKNPYILKDIIKANRR